MIEELKNERIILKVGGKFKLTALVQRRMGELLQGSRPLINDTQGMTLLEIVIQEVLQDKITIEGSAADTDARESNAD
ncbi:MAG: DNA-directed RNA polymerase subunit omega [Planctomycetes bacterium]|nr:DNA-directed RNA polymerase subunit omega [Planctomycetota bacterium]